MVWWCGVRVTCGLWCGETVRGNCPRGEDLADETNWNLSATGGNGGVCLFQKGNLAVLKLATLV